MKTAISIPDEVFEEADALARETGQSRSQLYSRAVREYLARHAPNRVTAALDALADEFAAEDGAFLDAATRASLERTEW